MKMENTHMTHGNGEDSYARNSLIQANSISKVFPVIQDALEGFYSTKLPKCVMIAELGCASGPNTLMLLPEIIDITYKIYRTKKHSDEIPEINMFLNDLPSNDFNSISESLANFHEELNKQRKGDIGPYFISATPGSYYKRLFPTDFLHFVHCSNSAHWLSRVPKKLISENGEYLNKGNVYIDETSPPGVIEAYKEQYNDDFTSFLKCRAKEIVTGGRMVINIMATTKSHKPQDYFMTKVTNIALNDMASEVLPMIHQGLIDKKKLDDFDFPFYPPTKEEVKSIVENEGSFHVEEIRDFIVDWDVPIKNEEKCNGNDNEDRGIEMRAKLVSGTMKSGTQVMLASHFGDHIIEELFYRVNNLIIQQLKCGKLENFHQAISLIKI